MILQDKKGKKMEKSMDFLIDCPPEKLKKAEQSVIESREKKEILREKAQTRMNNARSCWERNSTPFIKENKVGWVESSRFNAFGYRTIVGFFLNKNTGELWYSMSCCSPNDEFVKMISKNYIINEFIEELYESGGNRVRRLPIRKSHQSMNKNELVQIIFSDVFLQIQTGVYSKALTLPKKIIEGIRKMFIC